MLIRRFLPVLISLCLLITILVGCQSTSAPEPAATNAEPPAAPTATTADTTTSADAEAVADTATTDTDATESGDAATDGGATTDPPELADIITVVSRAEGLEQFAALAEQSGLANELTGDGPFTVLLPTNDAFAALPAAVFEDTELLATILREHVVEDAYLLDEMSALDTLTTLNGSELALLVGQTGGSISGSNVLGGDFQVSNGMIHIVDTVILPAALQAEILALHEPVAGETLQPMQGNIHIANNEISPVTYASTPPTSGPHYPNLAPWQVFEEPWRYEQLLHNLEDAGVVIYYQCPEGCPELVQQLRDLAQPLIDGGRHVLVAPNDPAWTTPTGDQPHQDMGAQIAVTAWRRTLKLDAFDADQINAFIEAFEGIDHHVKG